MLPDTPLFRRLPMGNNSSTPETQDEAERHIDSLIEGLMEKLDASLPVARAAKEEAPGLDGFMASLANSANPIRAKHGMDLFLKVRSSGVD